MAAMQRPIVIRGKSVVREPLRKNPAIDVTRFFGNFAAGHLVGASIAYHPHGEECGRHKHRGAVEMFVVMAGTGLIVIDDRPYKMAAGDCAVVPQGVYHNLIGVGESEPFTVMCTFVVAAGHENDKTPWVAE